MSLGLDQLSAAQKEAVTWDPTCPLQILAGPGSGKTRVLTTRVAWLVLGDEPHRPSLDPTRCVVVTFTNKAAREMRARLVQLIGEEKTSKLILGTFHATCARFLRRWGRRIGIDANFTIADVDDVKRMIKDIVSENENVPEVAQSSIKADDVAAAISRAKARSLDPRAFRASQTWPLRSPQGLLHAATSYLYDKYQERLRANNAMDFDDLLLHGAQLFRTDPSLARYIDHVLVDEFQDTNAVQYELMCAMASACRRVSIVGDPDQSIYSWRHAEMGNLDRMSTDFPSLHRVFLEENFRSTKSILAAAMRVMRQDTLRIAKGLYTSHAQGTPVVLKQWDDTEAEAEYVALEIQRQVQCSQGLLTYADACILLRFNALSRAFEMALQRRGIPYRVIGEARFFDRAEVKDLLAYLLLCDNTSYTPGVFRIINVPRRGLGAKTVEQLQAKAQQLGMPLFHLLEQVSDQHRMSLRPAVVKGVQAFVQIIHTLQKAAQGGASVSDLLQLLLTKSGYETYLRANDDFESRWENVQELISFAAESDTSDVERPSKRSKLDASTDASEGVSPLRAFLESSVLATDVTNEAESRPQVTISTCHAAKGLEWPIVFLPASEDGIFPFYRCTTPDEQREERRLFYVAMTRAETYLYVSWAHRRLVMGEWSTRHLSPFLQPIVSRSHGGTLARLSTDAVPWCTTSLSLTSDELATTATILGRDALSAATVASLAAAFASSPAGRRWDAIHTSPGATASTHVTAPRASTTAPQRDTHGFVSALNSLGRATLSSSRATDGSVRAPVARPSQLGLRTTSVRTGGVRSAPSISSASISSTSTLPPRPRTLGLSRPRPVGLSRPSGPKKGAS